MEIWALCYFLYNERMGIVVLSWGPGEISMGGGGGGVIFNTILQKVDQFLRLFTIIKLLILIQCFHFTYIMHPYESLVYNGFYIAYDYNYYNIVYHQCSILSGTKLSISNF